MCDLNHVLKDFPIILTTSIRSQMNLTEGRHDAVSWKLISDETADQKEKAKKIC